MNSQLSPTTFYERVMSFRDPDWGFTEYAQRLGLAESTLRSWAKGRLPRDPRTYIRLAEILDCSASWLYSGKEPEVPPIIKEREKLREERQREMNNREAEQERYGE